jgi:hypothetical protein
MNGNKNIKKYKVLWETRNIFELNPNGMILDDGINFEEGQTIENAVSYSCSKAYNSW